jgi:pyridoxal 5'-phosphate synthase pdxS subunit
MADEENHINKNNFKVPFVCGCRDLGEALRRIAEGASMLRTKGEAGTGNIVEAVRHARAISRDIRRVSSMDEDELFVAAKVLILSYRSYYATDSISHVSIANVIIHFDRT